MYRRIDRDFTILCFHSLPPCLCVALAMPFRDFSSFEVNILGNLNLIFSLFDETQSAKNSFAFRFCHILRQLSGFIIHALSSALYQVKSLLNSKQVGQNFFALLLLEFGKFNGKILFLSQLIREATRVRATRSYFC